MVNFYREAWKHRAHIMAPLTGLTKVGAKAFKKHWKQHHLAEFQKVKAMIAQDVLLYYPDHNKPFLIQTDASNL